MRVNCPAAQDRPGFTELDSGHEFVSSWSQIHIVDYQHTKQICKAESADFSESIEPVVVPIGNRCGNVRLLSHCAAKLPKYCREDPRTLEGRRFIENTWMLLKG